MALATPILPIVDALTTRIKADTPIMTVLRGVYSIQAPLGSPFPYIAFAAPSAVPEVLTFHHAGHAANRRIHIWSSQMNDREVSTIYDHLDRLFTRKPLTLLPDHVLLVGTMELIDIFPSEDKKLMHGVVDYRAQTRAVA
jgi:hypothetical protein